MKRIILIMAAVLMSGVSFVNAAPPVKVVGTTLDNVLEPDANGSLPSKAVNENGNPLSVDTVTRALITVDYAHHEVHEGGHFFACISNNDLDAGDTNGMVIVTDNSTRWTHSVLAVNNTTSADFIVYENTTYSGLGAALTTQNSNRNSTNTAVTAVYRFTGTTITDLGDQVAERLLGSNAPQTRSGGEGRGDNEIIMKQNTAYAVIIVGQADNGRMNLDFEFYEHTSKTD
jgi:hypothetical protein